MKKLFLIVLFVLVSINLFGQDKFFKSKQQYLIKNNNILVFKDTFYIKIFYEISIPKIITIYDQETIIVFNIENQIQEFNIDSLKITRYSARQKYTNSEKSILVYLEILSNKISKQIFIYREAEIYNILVTEL